MIYKITFFDYWHLSSGLSGGAKYDNSVIKDSNGFPYVPGKTIKGLLREYAQGEFLDTCFGKEGELAGICYFSNAVLSQQARKTIGNNKQYMFDLISSTAIDENGVAKTGSLREIEVVIPVVMYGCIDNIPENFEKQMITTLKKVKRMGLNRTRGLGRCAFEVLRGKDGKDIF